ncbi:hypothetical protein BDZ97DRAFT_1651486 [Flammula alnicola]|nr:hypothetical protein BDZ97DRAFT_1651486 [Flammula alnicola]
MPSFTFIVEDTSPMLVYSENWRAGTSETDSSLDQYTQSSFILTQTVGATLSFKFYGTSIQIAGAKRSNHGNYQIQLDGGSVSTFNGESDTAVFNQTLYSSSVTLGSHQLTVTNAGGSSTANSFLDLDYVAFQTSVGKDDENLIVNTFQDTHPSFIYTPSSSWDVIPDTVGAFSGSSGHATRDPSAAAKFTFQVSDAVALYGPVGPNNSLSYSVQVDGGSPSIFSAEKQFYLPQQLLFCAGNLGAGQHSLQIQTGSSGTGELAIDFANVYTTPSLGGRRVD